MGTTLLAGYETNVRNDLKDLNSSAYLWATSELDRHIAHAVADYSRIVPYLGETIITCQQVASVGPVTPIGQRQVFAPPPGYLWSLRVEYPLDQLPPMYRVFREEWPVAGSLYFPIGDPPAAGDLMKVTYAQQHVLSATESTIFQEHEELISLGAVAYAASAGTQYAVQRLNASLWTPRGIAAFAAVKMAEYKAWLEQLRASYGTPGAPWVQWGQWPWDWNRV